MMNLVPSNPLENITRIEYHGQPVLTTAQLAEYYETSPENIKRNFSNNADRFVECKHYFKVEGEDLDILRGKFFTCKSRRKLALSTSGRNTVACVIVRVSARTKHGMFLKRSKKLTSTLRKSFANSRCRRSLAFKKAGNLDDLPPCRRPLHEEKIGSNRRQSYPRPRRVHCARLCTRGTVDALQVRIFDKI